MRLHSKSDWRDALKGRQKAQPNSAVSAGDRVMLLSDTSDLLLEALLAVMHCGAIAVPISTRWSIQEVAAAVRKCQPKIIFCEPCLAHLLQREHNYSIALLVMLWMTGLCSSLLSSSIFDCTHLLMTRCHCMRSALMMQQFNLDGTQLLHLLHRAGQQRYPRCSSNQEQARLLHTQKTSLLLVRVPPLPHLGQEGRMSR